VASLRFGLFNPGEIAFGMSQLLDWVGHGAGLDAVAKRETFGKTLYEHLELVIPSH
jgi:hypothetical protein